MPQFYILFYANYTILATQGGAMDQWPPTKYVPDQRTFFSELVTAIRPGVLGKDT